MSTIYRVKNPETGEMQMLVSKDYVDLEIKRLKDALNITLPSILTEDTIVDLAVAENSEVKASDVQQDSEHRMLTESQLELFRRKPTMHEIKNELSSMKKALESKTNETYFKLLNMPNAVERLRRLSMILQNDEVLANLFKVLDDTITEDELLEHEESNKHLSTVDRKSLMLLQKVIDSGLLENAGENCKHAEYADTAHDVEYIGHCPSIEIFKMKSPDTIVVGHSDYCQECECHVYATHAKGYLDEDWSKVNYHIGRVKFSDGVFDFKKFVYTLNGHQSGIIEGSGRFNTKIRFDDMVTENISYRDLTLSGQKQKNESTLKTSYSTFRDVIFDNCIIEPETGVMFDGCTFMGCTFKFSKLATHIIIAHNHFTEGSQIPKFISKNVIIKDNFQ